MREPVLLVATLVVGLAAPAAAQSPQTARPLTNRIHEDSRARSDDRGSSLLHTLGGAAVGAWLGYMASQIAVSDWEESVDTGLRVQLAGGGALLGAIGGQLLHRRADARPEPVPPAPGGSPIPIAATAGDRSVISSEEIRTAGAANAYDVVQSLRNEWLQIRGISSFRESGSGRSVERSVEITPGDPLIIVYLDNARLGGVETMRNVPVGSIRSIEFLNATQASFRFGGGHAHGAILISTADDGR